MGSLYSNDPTCGGNCTGTCILSSSTYTCSIDNSEYSDSVSCSNACQTTADCVPSTVCTYDQGLYLDTNSCQNNCTYSVCENDPSGQTNGTYYLTPDECITSCPDYTCATSGAMYPSQYSCQNGCATPQACTTVQGSNNASTTSCPSDLTMGGAVAHILDT